MRPGPSGPSALLNYEGRTHLAGMAWFLRAVELPSSHWACRFGPHEYDRHATIDDAIAHLRLISLSLGPTELYVHHATGRVDAIGMAIT